MVDKKSFRIDPHPKNSSKLIRFIQVIDKFLRVKKSHKIKTKNPKNSKTKPWKNRRNSNKLYVQQIPTNEN